MSPPPMPLALPPPPGVSQEAALALLAPLEAMVNSANATFSSLNAAASSTLSAIQAPFRTASPAPITQPLVALIDAAKKEAGKLPAAGKKQTDQRTVPPESQKPAPTGTKARFR